MKLVITEKGTVEGYTSAWVAKRMLKTECELVQMSPSDKFPMMKGRDVLILGLSFSRNQVMQLIKSADTFHLFDNDFRARQELSGIKEVKINMNQSAGRMAWEHLRADFRVRIGAQKKTEFHISTSPWIVDYSENPKLWKWSAINPFFVKLAIDNCYRQELEQWDELATRDLAVVMEQGKEFAKKQQQEKEKTDGDSGAETTEEVTAGADQGSTEKAGRRSKR